MRLAHSKGAPRRRAMACNCSSLPSGSEPVSWRSRPIRVDLPGSTWPTMTIFNCPAEAAAAGSFPANPPFIAPPVCSHVAIAPQFLEGIFAFLVLRAACAFGDSGGAQFVDDFPDGFRLGPDRESAGITANRAIAFAFGVREIERNHGNIFALDVFPDVQLGPMEQRMYPDVCALFEIRFELVPQLRRLVRDVPFHVLVPQTEVTLFGARRLFIAPHADDDAGEMMLVEHLPERVFFQRAAAFDAGGFAVRIGAAGFERRLVSADNQFELPLADEPVAVFNHAGNFVTRVHMHEGKGNVAEERLAGEP